MDQKILKQADKRAKELFRKYPSINALILDNWRGWRFIYDAPDVVNCRNDCDNCRLYQLLKDEKSGNFTAALYPASRKDKILFGPQKFLNCKTLKQYRDCYIDFLLKKTATQSEIDRELMLVNNLKIMYLREGKKEVFERNYKKTIFRKTYALADAKKRRFLKKWQDVF